MKTTTLVFSLSCLLPLIASAGDNPFGSAPNASPSQKNNPFQAAASSTKAGVDIGGDHVPGPVFPPVPPVKSKLNPKLTKLTPTPSGCYVQLKNIKESLVVPASGGKIALGLRLSTSSNCTKLAMTNDEWVTVESFGTEALNLTIQPNTSKEERTTTLTIAVGHEEAPLTIAINEASATSAGGVQ